MDFENSFHTAFDIMHHANLESSLEDFSWI